MFEVASETKAIATVHAIPSGTDGHSPTVNQCMVDHEMLATALTDDVVPTIGCILCLPRKIETKDAPRRLRR